jgi:uncharacterized Zn-finger protein
MAESIVPHFHNAPGVPVIEIGAKEFQCVGATPPFDHPHVFLDMGDATAIICPYCSTLYRHDVSLHSHAARPPEALKRPLTGVKDMTCGRRATVTIAGAGIGGLTRARAGAARIRDHAH